MTHRGQKHQKCCCSHGIVFNVEVKMSVLSKALGPVLPFGFFVSLDIEGSDLGQVLS